MVFSDLKPLTTKHVHQVWQNEWDYTMVVSSKLREISPKLSDKLLSFCTTRKEDTVINHSYLTHPIIKKINNKKGEEEPPVCLACNTIITIKHTLIECADLQTQIQIHILYCL